MSDVNQARRTEIEVSFAGVDITESLKPYLLSLTYTDNEEDETDDLQIQLHDRDNIWLEKWLNQTINAAAENSGVGIEEIQTAETQSKKLFQYVVTRMFGAQVYSAPDTNSLLCVYGHGVKFSGYAEYNGWVRIENNGPFVKAEDLAKVENEEENKSEIQQEAENEPAQTSGKGLKISAVIVRENWNNDGKDDVLECGRFELDSIEASGTPSIVTIKGTSLPYSSTIRQTLKSKSWENYSLSGIAKQIAETNGMTCMFLSGNDPEYARIEQYRMSDIVFLQTLCHNAGCSLKVSDNIIIIFDQAEYETKDTVITVKHGEEGGYTNYRLSTNANDSYSSCRVSYTASDGRVISATAYIDDYNSENENNQCLEICQKVTSESEAKALAEKMLRLHNKYEFSAVFTFPGNPALLAGCTVRLSGWGAWDGKYIIKQARHTVNNSGYTTQITLRKALKNSNSNTQSPSGSGGSGISNSPASINSSKNSDMFAAAYSVLRGEWGSTKEEAAERLSKAGYDSDMIFGRLNELLRRGFTK